MVERGLRAQLQTKSFVTGQQMIMLDFVDDNEAVYSKIEGDLLEIPTVRSPNEALVDTVRELPVREIVVQAQGLLSNMNRLMAGEAGKPGVLPQTLAQFAQTAKALETRLPLLTTELQSTTREIRETLASARTALEGLNKTATTIAQRTDALGAQLDTGVRDFSSLAQRAQSSLGQFDRSLGRIEQSLGRMDSSLAQLDFALSEDAPLGSGLNQTMRQIEAASRSLRFMSDALQRQPNSLVFGAPVEKP
jgi:paraquat-inducible protein B